MDNISLIPRPKSDGQKGLPSFTSFRGPKLEFSTLTRWSGAVLVLLILAGGALFVWEKKLAGRLVEYDNELQQLISQRDISLEERIQRLNAVLGTFKNVLDEHLYWTQLFKILEARTLNNVVFKSFNGSNADNSMLLDGSTSSYASLAKQVKIIEDTAGVESVTASGISLSKEGKIDFSLNINFEENLLKKK